MTNMKAERGDLIRTITSDSRYFEEGEIFEVTSVNNIGVRASNSRISSLHLGDREYVIHRKAGEEASPYTCECCGDICDDLTEYRGYCSEECHDDFNGLEQTQDTINSPNHYTQGKFETIEIIEEITKGYSDGYVAYCVGNALKYLARAPFKHGEPSEDISKAAKYLAFASEYLDAESTQ